MMASQRRAERTRARLLHAAAVEISQSGYAGSSLQHISNAAGVTMGALTFHFPAKLDLAHAIQTEGAARTHETVTPLAQTPAPDSPALPHIVHITLALSRLLTTEPTVRAAARLTQERTPEHTDWKNSWLPSIHQLLDQAHKNGELTPGTTPTTVAALTRHLVSGLEQTTHPHNNTHTHTTPTDELADIWELILHGLTHPHPTPPHHTPQHPTQ